jgi:predicted lipoprotein
MRIEMSETELNYKILMELYTDDLENEVDLMKVKVESLEWALANMNKPIVTPCDKSQPQPGYSPMPFIVGPYTITCETNK